MLSSFVLVWSHPKWWQLFQVGISQGLLAKRGWQKCENTFSSEMCESFFRRRQFNLVFKFNSHLNNFRRILNVSFIQRKFLVQIECCILQIKCSVIRHLNNQLGSCTIIINFLLWKIQLDSPLSPFILYLYDLRNRLHFFITTFYITFLFYYFILFYAPQFYISRLQKMDGFWRKKNLFCKIFN